MSMSSQASPSASAIRQPDSAPSRKISRYFGGTAANHPHQLVARKDALRLGVLGLGALDSIEHGDGVGRRHAKVPVRVAEDR